MLVVENLKKSYSQNNSQALEILDVPEFRVDEGEQVVLIGASGGGKTTLLHIIAGITRPTEGRIWIDGIEATAFSEVARDQIRASKLGYIFQTFNLLPGFTALENVILGMTFSKGKPDSKRAVELLDRVGLKDRIHHKPGKMSVGEQQRVAVARALANRPRLLLADEPTANVDPQNKQQIVELIRNFCVEEKIALLLVTHAMEVASQFDRVDQLEDINHVVKSSRVEQ
ncbi:MAG: ABC transporter ATP-binding protein [Planctomycetota bacterium]|nr:ABC transporter ATP-binding protein [Pirellulaceae bacterium]MEC7110184.1 ABC transporter ATP-binding protein [Planctomycetota bacterium]MDP7377191.1 ABC transporter ATP-binding protein [Pirellulaceae bacterium]MEC8161087.1 ABC transporter ATP-binding protein [Planctomycetota bacterium]MEC8239863.1 ABC transporter ATP-binding protein [Planctomycetota bacterium]